MKSVCRLMPIYQEIPSEKSQDQKIDDIRRKLNAIRSLKAGLTINNQNINIQIQATRKQPLINVLLSRFHPQLKKNLLTPFNKGREQNLLIPKNEQFLGKVRKTKTESQEFSKGHKYKKQLKIDTVNFKSAMQPLLGKSKVMQPLFSKNAGLNIQSEEQVLNKNLFRNFRVSEQLKSLKRFDRNSDRCDQIIQNRNIERDLQFSKIKIQPKINEDRSKIKKTVSKSLSLKKMQEQSIRKVSENNRKNKIIPSNLRSNGIYSKLTLHSSTTKSLNNNHELAEFVALTNGIWANGEETPSTCKFYVGSGNNDELVRRLLQKRGLTETHKIKDANIIWTQKRDFRLMDSMVSVEYELASKKQTKQINALKWRCECGDQDERQECIYFKLTNKKRTEGHEIGSMNKFGEGEIKILPLSSKIKTHNHLFHHEEICYKKNLFHNLKHYYESAGMDPFEHLPLTFHIQYLEDNKQWQQFLAFYQKYDKSWIIKPGQNTNRGQGIMVEGELVKIRKIVGEIIGNKSTAIVQKYIMPLLYQGRKFDIRCYALVTVVNGYFNLYWYEEGYVRTASKTFDMRDNSRYIHLTNDAVQKHSLDYGKYQVTNKVSFNNLAAYLKQNYHLDFYETIYPKMVKLCHDAFESTWKKLHEDGKDYCFEIFGLDFMIDDHFKVWLIQINRNPCIQTASSLLKNLITNMLDNAFVIATDVFFKPRIKHTPTLQKAQTKFNLVFKRKLSQN